MMINFRRGQSILEVIIAVGVMVIGIAASAAMMTATERSVGEMMLESSAVALAEEGVQASISIGDRAWVDLALGTHGLAKGTAPVQWNFQGSSDTANGYTRTVTVSTVDAHTKKIVVVVSWQPAGNRTARTEQQLLFTDWAFL